MPHPASLLAVLTPTEVREFLPEPLLGQVRSLAREFRLIVEAADKARSEYGPSSGQPVKLGEISGWGSNP